MKDFNRNKNLLRALDDLDVSKIMDMFKNVFFEHLRRLAIHNYATYSKSFDLYTKGANKELKEFQLNKDLKIIYTGDLNILKDHQRLQNKTNLQIKSAKLRSTNSNKTAGLNANMNKNMKSTKNVNKAKMKNRKIQKYESENKIK